MSKFKERIKQRIQRLNKSDVPELRRFQREMFGGDEAIQAQETHHRWLFDENPYNGVSPQFWIFRDSKGNIQGQQAGIPFLLQAGDKTWKSSWAIDLMLSPDFRSRGIGAILNDEYAACNELSTAIGISDDAWHTMRRAGWIDLGTIPLYAKPLNSAGFRAGLPPKFRFLAPLSILAAPAFQLLERIWSLQARLRGGTVVTIDRFDERVNRIWEKCKDDYPLLPRHDLTFLRWRFDQSPCAGSYQRFYFHIKGELQGYAVIRYGTRHGRSTTILADFLCPARYQGLLLSLIVSAARARGANDFHCNVLSPHLSKWLMWAMGFIILPMRPRFMVRPNAETGPSPSEVGNLEEWFITMASSDMEWVYLDWDPD